MRIIKNSLYLILILLSVACSNVKKVQVIQDALTVKVVPDAAALAEKARQDSLLMVKGIVRNIANTKIDFKTMNAKVKMDYETINDKKSFIKSFLLG
jgi:hypothetical protein